MIPTYIIHDPTSGRNISAILKAVPDTKVIEAVINLDHPHLGCVMSHQRAIDMAAKARAQFVWVMEDDCVLTPAFSLGALERALETMLHYDCDVMNGGVLRLAGDQRTLSRKGGDASLATRVEGGAVGGQYWSSHFVVYRDTTYDVMRQTMGSTPDYGAVGIPIDLRPGHFNFRTFVTLPFMAIQSAGYSAIGRMQHDYGDAFAACERHLMHPDNLDAEDEYVAVVNAMLMPGMRETGYRTIKLRQHEVICINGVVMHLQKGTSVVSDAAYDVLKGAGKL